MTRRALVLRPEPGNAATVARLRAAGIEPVALPLFAAGPVPWTPPDAAHYDALLLTSANAVRHAGAGLSRFATLPVVAVGAATAAAARAAGLRVAITGRADAAAARLEAAHFPRLLHLAGRERVALPGVDARTVYVSARLPLSPEALDAALDAVVLLHSARAGRRFASLAVALPRARIRIAAISPAVLAAAGAGWADVVVAPSPDDAALVACAAALAIDPAGGGEDNRRA